jgi:hypothetical protein
MRWCRAVKKPVIVTAILLAGVAVCLVISVAIPLVHIRERLHRNRPAAESLAASLASRYPGHRINGAASYETDVIYVLVWGQLDQSVRHEMRDWLADEKVRRGIFVRGLLRFEHPNSGDDIDLEF